MCRSRRPGSRRSHPLLPPIHFRLLLRNDPSRLPDPRNRPLSRRKVYLLLPALLLHRRLHPCREAPPRPGNLPAYPNCRSRFRRLPRRFRRADRSLLHFRRPSRFRPNRFRLTRRHSPRALPGRWEPDPPSACPSWACPSSCPAPPLPGAGPPSQRRYHPPSHQYQRAPWRRPGGKTETSAGDRNSPHSAQRQGAPLRRPRPPQSESGYPPCRRSGRVLPYLRRNIPPPAPRPHPPLLLRLPPDTPEKSLLPLLCTLPGWRKPPPLPLRLPISRLLRPNNPGTEA